MSSDNHANYAKIGVAVLGGVVALVGTLLHFGGLRGRGNEILVETCYDKPVNGLSVGSDVNFRGVKIGSVREINFIGNKYQVEAHDMPRIYILLSIQGEYVGLERGDIEDFKGRLQSMVDKFGLRATVSATGITGMSRVELNFNPPDRVPLIPKISWTPRYPYIPPKDSLIDSFEDAAVKVMNQINRMDITSVWSNMSETVESLAAMSETTRNLVERRQPEIDRIMSNLESATSAVRDLAERLRENPSLLIRESRPDRLPETDR